MVLPRDLCLHRIRLVLFKLGSLHVVLMLNTVKVFVNPVEHIAKQLLRVVLGEPTKHWLEVGYYLFKRPRRNARGRLVPHVAQQLCELKSQFSTSAERVVCVNFIFKVRV